MSEPTISFTDDDVQTMKEFGSFVATFAQFNRCSLQDMITFHRLLIGYNRITSKVYDHVLEVGRVIEPTPEPPKRGKK